MNQRQENLVLYTVDEHGTATVTLNNPDKHNAFDDAVIARLSTVFSDISKRQSITTVVLDSTGKSFSAGADLGWMKRMAAYTFDENKKDASALANMLHLLNFLPQPTIAKVQGAAFGGAVGLASCCDIVIASDKASFCLSEVKLGLIPATISPYVVQAIGLKACRRYFLTAERFSAAKAEQLGLVSEVVPPEQLDDAVAKMITTLNSNGPEAVQAAKQLAFDVADKEIDSDLLQDTSERIAAIRVAPQGQEGLSAFFEKRSPNWSTDHALEDALPSKVSVSEDSAKSEHKE